ncbi:MAG TPA: sugar ABC transporter permease [Bacilli bacterium]|jgi:ABC-type sugar transport system permease subunit|nr:MAG: L-arabinose transport system permease protein AraP [Tenericutes bacterium ADurb.Bin140]HOE77730.1 sugar ABC transporter permease [Bacilli bacterium]HPK58105.1 sugar ABC transporter permease [Bacilli bacterium]
MFNRLKEKIKAFFSDLWVTLKEKYRTSKLPEFFAKCWHYVSIGLYYLFWPLLKLKQKTYDKLRYDQQKVVVSLIFLTPVLFGFIVFFAYPLIMSFIYSFSTVQAAGGKATIYFGQYFQTKGVYENPIHDLFHNYKYALRVNADFPVQLVNTIRDTAIDTVVIAIFSLLIAVMLNGKFKGRAFVRAVFFLPVILNSEAIDAAIDKASTVDAVLNSMGSGALRAIFDLNMFMVQIGLPVTLVNFLSGITTAIYRTISYSGVQILIFLAAIQSVPTHLYEAARIEGATKYESFWKITLPMVSPIIMTVVVYTIIDSFLRSEVNNIINIQLTNANYGYHAAMSWIYMICSILLLAVSLFILSKVVFYQDER